MVAIGVLAIVASCGGSVPTAPVASSTTPIVASFPCSTTNNSGDSHTSSPPQCVSFGGYEWVLKKGTKLKPGPNTWSDEPETVWTDAAGLHLRIANRNGTWYSAEAILNRSLGYGTYVFQTSSAVHQLDRNAVLGLFTYDYVDPAFNHRELDIEFSPLLGAVSGATGHFTVQPYQTKGNARDFVSADRGVLTHRIEWHADRVVFTSGSEVWTYTGPNVPRAGAENVRLNLWLFGGIPPASGNPVEVLFTQFSFVASAT